MLEVYRWEGSKSNLRVEVGTTVYKVGLYGLEEELVCWRAFAFLLLFETLGIAAVECVRKK